MARHQARGGVETIAARSKLEASVADTLKVIPVPHIDQVKESEAAFLPPG